MLRLVEQIPKSHFFFGLCVLGVFIRAFVQFQCGKKYLVVALLALLVIHSS